VESVLPFYKRTINEEMKMGTYKELEVWINSIKLVKDVYKNTSGFPKEELYSLTNQIRRPGVLIPANISEGSGRMQPKEFIYFLRISFGSLIELETLLLISLELDFLDKKTHEVLLTQIKIITVQLSRLIKALKN
jgi:four helix bundle protein